MIQAREFITESNRIENVHTTAAIEDSLDALEYLRESDELTHERFKRAHEILLDNRQPHIAGEYRDIQVYVGDDVPPPPSCIPGEMDALLQWSPTDPIEAIRWHIAFEHVHPFQDGNGRIGRLIYYWQCTDRLECTPVVWRNDDREGYYELFQSDIDMPESSIEE
jgi:Fic family protein